MSKCTEHIVHTTKTGTGYVGEDLHYQVNIHGEPTGELIFEFSGSCVYCGDTINLTGLVPDTRVTHPFPQGGKHARTTTK